MITPGSLASKMGEEGFEIAQIIVARLGLRSGQVAEPTLTQRDHAPGGRQRERFVGGAFDPVRTEIRERQAVVLKSVSLHPRGS
jgi:hypothetical protein